MNPRARAGPVTSNSALAMTVYAGRNASTSVGRSCGFAVVSPLVKPEKPGRPRKLKGTKGLNPTGRGLVR